MSASHGFKTIYQFVSDLNDMYGAQRQPLKYYHILLDSLSSEGADTVHMQKQCDIFGTWAGEHFAAILATGSEQYKQLPSIVHSDTVYIDIATVMVDATPIDRRNIFKHLLIILSVLVPEHKTAARATYATLSDTTRKSSENFIMNLVQDVSKSIDTTSRRAEDVNIGTVLNDIISSGAMTKIFSSVHEAMASGNLDMQDLLASASSMAQPPAAAKK